MKIAWTIAGIVGISALCVGSMTWHAWSVQKENQRLSLVNYIYVAEHRILKDEISELASKPTYDQGYKDALIRIGGPQVPGAYQDGWDDAQKLCGAENNYADGYHAAIQQFGYTKTTTMARWLVPEPKDKAIAADKSNKEGITPAKLEK